MAETTVSVRYLAGGAGAAADPASAAVASSARSASLTATHDGHAGTGGHVIADAGLPGQEVRRPNTAPAYYLGRPASVWITAMRPRRRRTASHHLTQAVTGG